MNPLSNLLNTFTSAYKSVDAASRTSASSPNAASAAVTGQDEKAPGADSLTLSSTAVELSQKTSYAAPYFPTRANMSASALMMAVANPGLVSSSKGLSFADVATAARKSLDDKYAQMKASGSPYDANSPEGRDTNSLLGDLDRRSLYAISSNQGGLFTKDEQDAAANAMSQQISLAIGIYKGPSSQAGNFVDPYAGNDAARLNAALSFLTSVSPEERNSTTWLQQRLAVENGISSIKNPAADNKIPATLFEVLAQTSDEPGADDEDPTQIKAGIANNTTAAKAPTINSTKTSTSS
jgi:hypothetical protein